MCEASGREELKTVKDKLNDTSEVDNICGNAMVSRWLFDGINFYDL